jgi:BASS family bile acid:Na+ symporter
MNNTLNSAISPAVSNTVDMMQINFNPTTMMALKVVLALVMLGVALDIHVDDLKKLFHNPRPLIAGLIGQFLLLPAFTFVIVSIFKPQASIAMGMILVAACPGGNLSALFTMLARGNTALSVSLTFMATMLAMVMTPFNITFWGSMYGPGQKLVQKVALNPMEIVYTVVLVLGIPLVVGLIIRARHERWANRLQKILKNFSFVVLFALIGGAFLANFDNFIKYIHVVAGIVFVHNLVALLSGYSIARLFKTSLKDRKAITIEVGIQNSGLGLALAFEFFQGIGGVTMICAWWGIWHIIAGSTTAFLFQKFQNSSKSSQKLNTQLN